MTWSVFAELWPMSHTHTQCHFMNSNLIDRLLAPFCCASVTDQYNLVLVKRRWCPVAGKVITNHHRVHHWHSVQIPYRNKFRSLRSTMKLLLSLVHECSEFMWERILELASCLIYAKPVRHPFRAFIEYICGCVLFQDVTVREIRGR